MIYLRKSTKSWWNEESVAFRQELLLCPQRVKQISGTSSLTLLPDGFILFGVECGNAHARGIVKNNRDLCGK